jgi:flagellar basal-body rod modification protein FlgD
MVDAVTPQPIKSAPGTPPPGSTPTGSGGSSGTPGIADNFIDFLSILTTQLKNQNPLDPLDTNQFTQQLVQFAQVEQTIKGNDQLTSLLNVEKSAQSTQALVFIGSTVAVDGSTAQLPDTQGAPRTPADFATWHWSVPQETDASLTITNGSGQTVFSQNVHLKAGGSSFSWDGKGNDGTQFPPGNYKISITAKDKSGTSVAIPTEVEGRVDSVDFTSTPALLSIGGQSYTVDKVKRVVVPSVPAPASSGDDGDSGSGSGSSGSNSGSSGSGTSNSGSAAKS